MSLTGPGVTVRDNDAADLGTISLANGDCDGNNAVDAYDLSILLTNVGQAGDS